MVKGRFEARTGVERPAAGGNGKLAFIDKAGFLVFKDNKSGKRMRKSKKALIKREKGRLYFLTGAVGKEMVIRSTKLKNAKM